MRPALIIALLLAAALLAGCGNVNRYLVVETIPSQAEVFVDGEYRGLTPHTERFVYYGTHLVEVRKRGYASQELTVSLPCPWYLGFPLDFFCENVLPVTITDRHVFSFQLETYNEPTEDIVRRAKVLNRQAEAILEQ